jgi:uncharacterized protein YdcH (DUF465 family)
MSAREHEFTIDPMKELKSKIAKFDKTFQGNDLAAQIESAIKYLEKHGYTVSEQ